MVETGIKRINLNKGKRVVFEKQDECIVCTSYEETADGYIRVYAGKGEMPRMQLLHRLVWKATKGTIPDSHEIDHKCRNRRCCNIEHLQILSRSEHKTKGNLLRYADRIASVKSDIRGNLLSTEEIAIKHNVPIDYVTRYKRNLKKE